jgi:hypothetical protein
MIKRTHKIQQYLKIPYHILNIPGLKPSQKQLLAHIYGFGARGCWQSNRTLAKIFMVSPCTISRWLKDIKDYIYIKNPSGFYRTLWAKAHPNVGTPHFSKNAKDASQKCSGDYSRNAKDPAQKCAAINKGIREITTPASFCRKTDAGASPCPRPLEGGTAATPEERQSNPIGHLTESIGKHGKWKPLSEEEFQKRREKLQKVLLGDNWREKLDEIKNKDFLALRKKQNDKSKKMD